MYFLAISSKESVVQKDVRNFFVILKETAQTT